MPFRRSGLRRRGALVVRTEREGLAVDPRNALRRLVGWGDVERLEAGTLKVQCGRSGAKIQRSRPEETLMSTVDGQDGATGGTPNNALPT